MTIDSAQFLLLNMSPYWFSRDKSLFLLQDDGLQQSDATGPIDEQNDGGAMPFMD